MSRVRFSMNGVAPALKPAFVPAVGAALMAAGCASSPAPIVYKHRPPPPLANASYPPSPPPSAVALNADAYIFAAPATLISQLPMCAGTVSNAGAVDQLGLSATYTPYIFATATTLLRMPVQAGCLSSGYGYRGTATGGGRQHSGIDLANRAGGFIYAAGDGRVTSVGWKGDYGLAIEIDHGGGLKTLYGHMSEVDPRLMNGSLVTGGVAIGRMGMTGNATGVHLHYEVTVDGVKVDPLNYGAVQWPPEGDLLAAAR